MGFRNWGAGLVIIILVGTQAAHTAHPLDPNKRPHTHVEAEYTHVGSSGVLLFSTGASGTRPYAPHR